MVVHRYRPRIMRLLPIPALLLVCALCRAEEKGLDVRMPLVEATLSFLESQALSSPSQAELLRAGALRVCGEKLDRDGCRPQGVPIPGEKASGPDAARAWRLVLESALAAASMQGGADFDKLAFQRFVMDGMVESLGDPNSFYLVPSVYRKIGSIPASFTGFGFPVFATRDSLIAGAVHERSPAALAGLLSGDRIVGVNGLPVCGYHRPLALAAIWGADGNRLVLRVARPDGGAREIKITYKPWTFHPYAVERRDGVVLVRLRYFDRGLGEQLEKAFESAASGLVIDLRDAASGDESEMVRLADMLLEKGSIGSRETRSGFGNRTWVAAAGSPGEQLSLPVAVVVNRNTSGLSELLAAALRKQNRAILVGESTAGRDTQETLRPFEDGSAIQVTSTRLLGPDRDGLDKGVLPHLASARSDTPGLAVEIVKTTKGPALEQLFDAGRQAVDKPEAP